MEALVLYTIPDCPFCSKVRNFLLKNKKKFKEINVMENKRAWQKIYEKAKLDVVPILEQGKRILIAKPGQGISINDLENFLKNQQ